MCAVAVTAIGCNSVLGLDPSLRDPCVLGGCADDGGATAPTGVNNGGDPPQPVVDSGVSVVDSGPPPSSQPPPIVDAGGGPDTSVPDAAVTFRCGDNSGGGGHSTDCDQSTQTCCATFQSGAFDFTCMQQTDDCSGVPISCARQADCPGNSVCCVTDSSQSCVTRGTCTGDLVCDPNNGHVECPQGRSCVPFQNPSVPYFFCH